MGWRHSIRLGVFSENKSPPIKMSERWLAFRIGLSESPGKRVAPYETNACLRLAKLPGIEGIWQEHRSLLDPDPRHNTAEEMIANFEDTADCKGNWIRTSVGSNGKFTVTNGWNGFSKTYLAAEH
jgi:hypothetical protein